MREEYGRPEYEVLWRQARKAVARGQVKLGYKAPDHGAAAAVSALIGSRLTAGIGTTIVVTELDAALRAAQFHCGLEDVLAAVHGSPAEFSPIQPSVDASRREWADEILTEALTAAGLATRPWARIWIDHVRRYAKIAPERLAEPAKKATAILARLTLDPSVVPAEWIARTDLAKRHGDAFDLDRGRKVAGMVLRAAALAHGMEFPRTARDEQALWQRCGVAADGLSTSVLCWELPTPTELPLHVTTRDLPWVQVPSGTVVWVCESPRVLEAAIDAGLRQPMVCLSGHLNTVARELLSRLAACGAVIRCHGDFDANGLLITRQIIELTGGLPWRMSADDYRAALDLARSADIDLPPLGADPGPSPWNPALLEAMRAGWAVEEEVTLPHLLADLSDL
jgi:uncharacterized protein (TIGR02679 family)